MGWGFPKGSEVGGIVTDRFHDSHQPASSLSTGWFGPSAGRSDSIPSFGDRCRILLDGNDAGFAGGQWDAKSSLGAMEQAVARDSAKEGPMGGSPTSGPNAPSTGKDTSNNPFRSRPMVLSPQSFVRFADVSALVSIAVMERWRACCLKRKSAGRFPSARGRDQRGSVSQADERSSQVFRGFPYSGTALGCTATGGWGGGGRFRDMAYPLFRMR